MSERHDPATDRGAARSSDSIAHEPATVGPTFERESRRAFAILLAGPIIWAAHFMLVYTISEAGCTGGGPGLRRLGPPVPTVVTLAATAVGALACAACAWWAHRRWQQSRRDAAAERSDALTDDAARDLAGSLCLAGYLLALVSLISVLMVGLPALVLGPC